MATRPPWPRQGRRRPARRRRWSGSPARTTASVHLPADERGDLQLVQLRRERRVGGGGAPARLLDRLHVPGRRDRRPAAALAERQHARGPARRLRGGALPVEPGRNHGDADLAVHRRIVHGPEDDLGLLTRRVLDDVGDLGDLAERQVLAAGDVDQYARRAGDRDVVEQWRRDRLLHRLHRAVFAPPHAGPHDRRAAVLHHGAYVGEIHVHDAGDRDERGDALRGVQQHFVGLFESIPFQDALKKAEEVLLHATQGISSLITVTGIVNVDFADVRTVMQNGGAAIMGTGMGRGENRAMEAVQQAISSPLLDNISITGATGVLINITGGEDLTLGEVTQISDVVKDAAGEEAEIIFGTVNDPAMHGEIRVTVIATGFDRQSAGTEASGRAAPGVLPFRERAGRPAVAPPGYVKPAEQPARRGAPPNPPLPTELNELEIPTFIRRQMD